MNYEFPFKLQVDRNGWAATFPDLPEFVIRGATCKETLDLVEEGLATALSFYVERSRRLPRPSEGFYMFRASVSNSAFKQLEQYEAKQGFESA